LKKKSLLKTLYCKYATLRIEKQNFFITATHSPLVMASVEPSFDESKDAWFDLDLVVNGHQHAEVELKNRSIIRRGDVSN